MIRHTQGLSVGAFSHSSLPPSCWRQASARAQVGYPPTYNADGTVTMKVAAATASKVAGHAAGEAQRHVEDGYRC